MKKNLLDGDTVQETIARVKALQDTSKAGWGEMEVTEMLRHCNLTSIEILHGKGEIRKSSLKQLLMKFLALHVVPKFPKNIKGSAKHDAKGKATVQQFGEEKEKLIKALQEFAVRKSSFQIMHPVFGNLTTRQWGTATWMHIDHHLRKFGV